MCVPTRRAAKRPAGSSSAWSRCGSMRKIRILFYLLEARPEYFAFFMGEGESWGSAAWGVARSVLQTAGKYLKGSYLIRRHGLLHNDYV